MNGETVITALELPPGALVGQRVPKKLLFEHGAPTAGDKRLIHEGIAEVQWVAALKPTTIGVPEFRDETREYLEVAVLRLVLRAGAKALRLMELVHRAVPYPVLLVTDSDDRPSVSAAHKRWSQGERGKVVIDGEVVVGRWSPELPAPLWQSFLHSLQLARQARTSLLELYQGWLDAVHALLASKLTGTFSVAAGRSQAEARREALRECGRIEAEMARLRAMAIKEKQIPRRVELNLKLKRLEADLARERQKL
jgi:hypothetical protein